MRATRLVWRALAFHARAHAATALGAAVAGAVLTGALVLGDSVRASLARAARERTGALAHVLGNGERFFAADLAVRMAARAPGLVAEPGIQLPAVVANPDASGRVPDAQLLGVRAGFFGFAPAPFAAEPAPEEAWAGAELARRLRIEPGSELVLRVPRPSTTTRELALVSAEDALQVLRVRVTRVLAGAELGAFALEAGAAPRANLFVSHAWLAARLGVPERANRVFLRGGDAQAALAGAWELADVGLAWKTVAGARELSSDQVFLPHEVLAALEGEGCRSSPAGPPLAILGYFVNAIARGHAPDAPHTPYSTVVALGSPCAEPAADLGGWRAALGTTLDAPTTPPAIVLNQWTAEDLGATVGDEIVLRYFVLGPGRRLAESSSAFRLARILPTAGLGADPSLSPEFPGIGDAENCRDWDPGIPIELDLLRERDEEYWDLHRGAPKAFLDLATARALFGNRFGALTALRFAPEQEELVTRLLRARPPDALGLPLRAVSAASAASTDFGTLFLGLSMFLIASALLLTGLFFAFSVERRAAELGVLRVSGFRAVEVARLFLGEALSVCLAGATIGLGLGCAYTRLLLAALERRWSGAVGRTELHFALEPRTLVLAFGLTTLLALGSAALVLWRARRARPLALLAGEVGARGAVRRAGRPWLVLGATLAALACLAAGLALGAERGGPLGFGAGFLALLAGLGAFRRLLARASRPRSRLSLGWTNAARRPGRSLATVASVASSVFLLTVAGASRQGPAGPGGRDSGTGGFAFLGRSNLPVLHDLESAEGRAFYGLSEAEMDGVTVVPLRVRAGDEASCLNLDQPRSPRLLGLAPERLAGRFRFAATLEPRVEPWTLLGEELADGAVPVVVDAVSLQWTLKKGLGDELELVDGRGRPFRARVVATVADSILQGDVLLAERRFEALFPDEVGQRAFLIDASAERAAEVGARLARALADEGLALEPAHERLDLLHGVQNTYLAIFQALGGLGLVLGSVGLFALVLRSALERRAELACLGAVGFARGELRALFVGEHGGLVWSGLVLGMLAGACAVLPRFEPATLNALRTLGLVLLAVGLSGALWSWLATFPALRGSLRETLARE